MSKDGSNEDITRKITPEIVRETLTGLKQMDEHEAMATMERVHKALGTVPESTAMLEIITGCDPRRAVATHLHLIEIGIRIAERALTGGVSHVEDSVFGFGGYRKNDRAA